MNTNAKYLVKRVLVGPEATWDRRLSVSSLLTSGLPNWVSAQFLVFAALLVLAFIPSLTTDVLFPNERPASMRDSLPVNWPTFETHRAEAEEVCKGKVVPASEKTPSPDAVVVGLDGRTVLMDTDELWDRVESKNEYDNVWTIGVCKSHIQK